MKSIPPQSKRRISLEEADALAQRDKRRLIIMGLGLVMLVGAFVFGQFYRGKYAAEEELSAPPVVDAPEQESSLFFPERPDDDLLAGIADATADQRVVVDSNALQAVLTYSVLMTEQHYEELGIVDVDPDEIAALAANADERRMDALRARGTIELLRTRHRDESTFPDHYGTLALEDGGHAHFVVVKPPEEDELAVGDFVRLDGMFLQNYSVEIGPEWVDGPLLLGRSLTPSYARADVGPGFAMPHLEAVQDDTMEAATGEPVEALWELMTKAKLASDEVDWANAPELSKEMLNQIFQNGAMHRGQPFRLPISKNMGSWNESVGENPLRLEKVARGWIGNYTWNGNIGLIKFVAPFEDPDLDDWQGKSRLLAGRAFFLKNLDYEDRRGQPGRVPFFVFESLAVHTPDPDETPMMLMWVLLGGLALFIAVVTWLLARDKRESAKLQEELLRRRRARREKAGGESLATQEP